MIEDLFDVEIAGRPLVTYVLVVAMLVVSLPTLAEPGFYRVFGGVGELAYPWQVFSSAFEHGWHGVPLLPHLLLDLLLIFIVGVAAEGMLGSARYLLLTLLAIACCWLTREATNLQANGSSVFIWSYTAIVFLGLKYSRRRGGTGGPVYERLRSALIVMWLVVPVALGILAMARGSGPLMAVLRANVFHISGLTAGTVCALGWRRHIARRVSSGHFDRSPYDTSAVYASAAIPMFFLLLLILSGLGVIQV